ncbi:glycerol-3-phosphate acyltransferase [Dehalogenimonas sp. THU2]|uniref:glycerol-3-phosphate acyltransferase n=1 Tax=Dehalogenimonas sp. THU2 TaxID=3151121 RepID=UPI00321834D6
MLNGIAIVVAAYFIGAFPHLLILARLHRIEPVGDLHIALWQKAGAQWGLIAIAIDVGKGALAVWMAGWLDFDIAIVVFCALAATAGQMWTVFRRFNGEKGNTTAFGAALALAVTPAAIALIPVVLALVGKLVRALRQKGISMEQTFRLGAGQSNALPVAVALTFILLPIVAWLLGEPRPVIWGFAGLAVMILFRRITAGLNADLKTGTSLWRIFWWRLLLDRAV